MVDFIAWWIAVEALSLVALPIAFFLFSGLPTRGYALAKPLGLLLLGYLVWLVGLTGLISLNRWSILLIALVLGGLSFWLLRPRWQAFIDYLRRQAWTIVAVEVLFLAAFAGWAVVRSYNPAIYHTEQPMDFALLNSIIRAESMPPQDPWLSGNSVSYYYFGYLMHGTLAKATGVPGPVAYNLALALLFALTAAGAFGLAIDLVLLHRGEGRHSLGAVFAFGLLAVLLLVGIGNLEGMGESVRSLGLGTDGVWDSMGVRGIEGAATGHDLFPDEHWWWWRSTRVIEASAESPNLAITEFPSFSFVLGDLHPHVMSLPFLLLTLGLSLNALGSQEAFAPRWLRSHPVTFIVIALCLGALGFLNSWDLPTGLALFLLCTLMASYRAWGLWDWARLKGWAIFALALAVLSVLLFLPFYLGPRPSPIFPWVAQVEEVNTRYVHYLLVLGLPLFLTLSLLILVIWRWRRPIPRLKEAAWGSIVFLPFLLWALVVLLIGLVEGEGVSALEEIGIRFTRLLPLHLLLAIGLLITMRIASSRQGRSQTSVLFILVLLISGLLLTLGPELFRIVDLFDDRMNTVFKFYYQAWILMALASAFAVYYLATSWSWRGPWRGISGSVWGATAAFLIVGSAFFPAGALIGKTNSFSAKATLDGLAFVKARDAAEAQALEFLLEDASEGSVIVEAVAKDKLGRAAGDYDPEYARISGRTGLPTILGWAGHEEQWRGSRRTFRDRLKDVEEIYAGSSVEATRELLDKYGVTYVYIGRLERALYNLDDTAKLDSLMDRAFDEGSVIIFKVRR